MKRFYLIAVFILMMPVVLNFVLPIETGLNNLGGEGNPTIWLSFWGAYLAALGSFFLGFISYCNNKEAVKQNEKILNNIILEQLEERFDHLENYVANEEKHYNESFIKKVVEIMRKCQDNNERLIFLYSQKQNISLTSLNIIRFIEQERANEYHNETGRALYEYGMNLKKASCAIEAYIDELIKTIEVESSHSLDVEKFEKDNVRIINEAIDSCRGLKNSGTQLLQSEKKRIREVRKKISSKKKKKNYFLC